MIDNNRIGEKTISDFGKQWSKYTDNEGWYGSHHLFKDITGPLLDPSDLNDDIVADIGSGTGRIVDMLLKGGAKKIYAIEPAPEAFAVLLKNIKKMDRGENVIPLNAAGDQFELDNLDCIFSIGVLHHIPQPGPVMKNAFDSLKPGGFIFAWLYGYEGNEAYVKILKPILALSSKLPHKVLRVLVEFFYWGVLALSKMNRLHPLALNDYLENIFLPLAPDKRRLVIYDQLKPAYAKYYKRVEAIDLFLHAGFENIELFHRHGYSWSVLARKPFE